MICPRQVVLLNFLIGIILNKVSLFSKFRLYLVTEKI
jgi:hypothetical protein